MKTKLIGVTARVDYNKSNVRRQFVNERYLTPLVKMGFNTIMLTLDNPNLEEILALCDGFVITGGTDITPSYFNEEDQGSNGCDIHMDELDKAVVEYAAKHKIPTIGICRGHQSLNVFLGGNLHQDIGDDHRSTRHKAKVVAKDRFFDFPVVFEINSYHHQSLKTVADGFEVIIIANDNTIEAMVHKTLPIISFQWHPEVNPDEEVNKQIFKKFGELINS